MSFVFVCWQIQIQTSWVGRSTSIPLHCTYSLWSSLCLGFWWSCAYLQSNCFKSLTAFDKKQSNRVDKKQSKAQRRYFIVVVSHNLPFTLTFNIFSLWMIPPNVFIQCIIHTLLSKWNGQQWQFCDSGPWLCLCLYVLYIYIHVDIYVCKYIYVYSHCHPSGLVSDNHSWKKCFCLREPVFWGRIFLIWRRNFPNME